MYFFFLGRVISRKWDNLYFHLSSLTLGPVASAGHRFRRHRGVVSPAASGETAAEGAAAHGAGGSGRATWNIQVIALKRFVWSFSITPPAK